MLPSSMEGSLRLAARRASWLRSSAAPAPVCRPPALSSAARRAHTFGGGWRAARAPTLAAGARRSPGALCRRQLSTGEQAPTATDQLKKAKQRNKLLFGGIAAGLVGTGLYHYEEILQWKDDFWEMYTKPARKLLLPPIPPEQKGMKTLVVSFCTRLWSAAALNPQPGRSWSWRARWWAWSTTARTAGACTSGPTSTISSTTSR